MRTITWHLSGIARKTIVATGLHVQDAFSRLSLDERNDITLFCTHVTVN
jgi:hypothetical protein